ncbi:phage baseplate plug family protein [Lactiplantibacillus daowaiensis]|uniref:Phage baseplate plug protein n=1 Tax=Lactiplantibacillus daowaiensis TaxID=2559918 RepID=A0ABW1RY19_9LACO|nr:hypothetical protein [Lactiplantibacillus daowaiensis]
MALRDTIEVVPDDMPYSQEITLDSGVYFFTFQYNKIDQQFTIDIADLEGNDIKTGIVVMAGQPLWTVNKPGLPAETIIPMDESGNETEVTFGNFGDTMNLAIDGSEGDLSDT